jgi:catechol 2,3-dioxygenase-like lactoylglutathione lyase family enzyme
MTALYDGIDRVILPVSNLEAACAPFERLGLVLSPESRTEEPSTRARTLSVGGPDNLFGVEILSLGERKGIDETDFGRWLKAVADRGLSTIVPRVTDIDATLATLAERGVKASAQPLMGPAGEDRGRYAVLPELPDAATGLILLQPAQSGADRLAANLGGKSHALPLKRLDHLAAVAPDLERSCKFWDEVLGVPTVGEVVSPVIVVRQLKIGDAILELLGPSSPDSPIRQRPPGLGSSCSFEVDDLEAAIAHARGAGFEVPDSRVGTLPGTRVTTIPGGAMSGLNLQLLQYV